MLSFVMRILCAAERADQRGAANPSSLFGHGWQNKISTELSNSLSQWLRDVPEHCESYIPYCLLADD